jgi:hypothetical protein
MSAAPRTSHKKPPSVCELSVLDVVGIDSETHGRSCTAHLCCGHNVKVGDILFCSWQIQLIDDEDDLENAEPEEVIQVHKVDMDGHAYCHVGYLAKRVFRKYGPKQFDKMFLRVKVDYRISDNSHERCRSHHYHGMALCSIIRDDNRFNGKNPLEGDACLMGLTLNKLGNSGDDDSTSSEPEKISYLLSKRRQQVPKDLNRRKPIKSLGPRVKPPKYEPRRMNFFPFELASDSSLSDVSASEDDDDIPIEDVVSKMKKSKMKKVRKDFQSPAQKRRRESNNTTPENTTPTPERVLEVNDSPRRSPRKSVFPRLYTPQK